MADPVSAAAASRSAQAGLMSVFERMRAVHVWVVGDLMVDEYAIGDAERISPEAPVPVIRVRRSEQRLGGAANVARQVAVLGARVSLGGLVGADAAGDQILRQCADAGIDTRAVRRLDGRPTTRKLRGLARNQQLLRLDWEDTSACPAAEAHAIVEQLRTGSAPDVIIVSDYAKGVLVPALLDEIADTAASAGTRIVVDPKRTDLGSYRGASIITPNLHELELAARRAFDTADAEAIATAAQSLAVAAGAEALVVKLGGRGMLVAPARGRYWSVPARGRALFDTTGAGDTVIALLASALAAGAPLELAARVANAAAGVAVSRVGTVSVEPEAIIESLYGEGAHKVLGRDELAARVNTWRRAGKRIAFTNGCFDLLHTGHLSLLREAAACGDVLIVAINSDASVRRLKGPERPLIPEHERAAMLAALACIDAVTIFEQDTPLNILTAVRPDVLVKGQDYRVDQVVGRELVESSGGRIVLVPLVAGKSTSALIERIARH